MRLAVTGAGGMLGGHVVAVAQRLGHDVVALDRAACDVTDDRATRMTIGRADPAAVVNCAAWTDVDGAESDEAGATAVNRDGALHVARAAADTGARLVHVSTDYVFDGERVRDPWVESDPPGPLGAYGRSKLAGEEQVAATLDDHAIVRSSWLFGVGGRNFVDTILRAGAERDELSVVTDQVGSPTWCGHLAEALVELAERPPTGVFHVAGAGRCSWYELAVEALDGAGVAVRVTPTTSDTFVRPAKRPAWSVLATERDDCPTLPPWQEGLAAYLRDRAATEVTSR